MLFNSLEFIFLFLPLTLAGYYTLVRFGMRQWIFLFLVFASLVFYSVWNPPYVFLLIGSMLANYLIGLGIHRTVGTKTATAILSAGVALNLAVLGWFKYANFFLENANAIAGTDWTLQKIILPLAISFYTFQQIAYLVDVARKDVQPGGLFRYATFVIFFPQLIAGPIVHYREMMPQFFGRNLGRFVGANLTVGIAIFAVGLFKKTVIADSAALYASPVFGLAHDGNAIGLYDAWKAAICYTIQLYFDFSGYSDMAIGLARMFGIKLPVNFNSPLRAMSIIEYWRRWHMTLQQFIVAYMYQPLVLPLARVAANTGLGKWASFYLTVGVPTFVIFVVIGLWHGAAWTYVLFGTLHGFYLATNEFWRLFMRRRKSKTGPSVQARVGYHVLTLFCVLIANVVFRAETVSDAMRIWLGLFRFSDLPAIATILPTAWSDLIVQPMVLILLSAGLIALAPNTQQLFGRYHPVYGWAKMKNNVRPVISVTWRPTLAWAVWTGVVLFLGVAFVSRGESEFIYFNF